VRAVLEAYAQNIHHVGPLGHGQKLKLLNNLAFATNLMNAAELLRMAQSQGFEAATVAKVLQACSGASFAMARFVAGGAAPSQVMERAWPYLVKDVATIVSSAEQAGLDIDAFAATAAYFRSV
jgi:3-hydroxyisobutyrate dehydrogenase-like beta-hydroxyacid dehydrogenase